MLKKIFSLPPVEKRKMSQQFLARAFRPLRFTTYSDDTYIMYQCGVVSFIVALCLQFLYLVSLLLDIDINLYFFTISLPKYYFIAPYAISFTHNMSVILYTVIVPFFLVKYFYNINPKKVDVAWWDIKASEKLRKSRIGMIARGLFLFIVTNVIYFGSFALPLFLMKYSLFAGLHSSLLFFIFLSLLYLILYYGFPSYVIVSVAILYRYIGSYSKIISSSSIREGKHNGRSTSYV